MLTKKIIFIVLLLIVVTGTLQQIFSQTSFPPAYEIRNVAALFQSIDNVHWQILEDTTGHISFEQVSRLPVQNRFHTPSGHKVEVDNYISAYWFRFRLFNNSGMKKNICFDGANTGGFELYVKLQDGNSSWQKQSTGNFYPWRKKNGYKNTGQLPLSIPRGDSVTIYIRVHFSYDWWYLSQGYIPQFGNTEEVIYNKYISNEAQYLNAIRSAFLDGIIVFGSLLSLFFFSIVKERIYLFFGVMMLALGFGRSFGIFHDTVFREYPQTLIALVFIITSFADYFLVQFARRLLELPTRFSLWDTWFNRIAVINVVLQLSVPLFAPLFNASLNKFCWSAGEIADSITLLSVFFSFILLSRGLQKKLRLLTVSALPALLVWGAGNLLVALFDIKNRYGLPVNDFLSWFSDWFYFIEMICIIILEIFFSWILLLRFADLQKDIEREKIEKAAAEFAYQKQLNEVTASALRSQMNPHFIFNALNTIQSFIYYDDRKKANLYLGKFSDLIRKVLDNSNKTSISLAEELELLKLYLDIEQSRFEDSLQVSITVDRAVDTDETEIPPMLIQPYAENAIKHGLLHFAGQKKLAIIVTISTDKRFVKIAIDDNGIGRVRSAEINQGRLHHHSFATKATEKRIDLINTIYNKNIMLDITDKKNDDGSGAGTTVIIRIPV